MSPKLRIPGHLLFKKKRKNNEKGGQKKKKKRASKRKKKLNERTRLDIIQWSTVVLGTLSVVEIMPAAGFS